MSRSRSSTPRAASCRRGDAGRICTRGYSVMLGYWDDAERDRGGDRRAGWMHTGDLATHRRGGLLQHRRPHQGHGHPRRRERLSARDRGVPATAIPRSRTCRWSACPTRNTARSSAPGSSSSPARRADAEEIHGFCRGQIAHYKIPRYVKFVDEFPMTVTGKVQKFLMREEMVKELGLSEQKTA